MPGCETLECLTPGLPLGHRALSPLHNQTKHQLTTAGCRRAREERAAAVETRETAELQTNIVAPELGLPAGAGCGLHSRRAGPGRGAAPREGRCARAGELPAAAGPRSHPRRVHGPGGFGALQFCSEIPVLCSPSVVSSAIPH